MTRALAAIILLCAPASAGYWGRLWDRPAPELARIEWIRAPEANSITGLRGRVVLLAFWNDLDQVSDDHAAQLQELFDRYEERGLRVIAVTRQDAAVLARLATRWRVTFALARVEKYRPYFAGGKDPRRSPYQRA